MNELRDIVENRAINENMSEEELIAAIEDLRSQFTHILDDDMMGVAGGIDDMIDHLSDFFAQRDAVLDAIARQELTPQNIGEEVGKAFRESARDVGEAIAEALGMFSSEVTPFGNNPSQDLKAAMSSVTAKKQEIVNHHFELHAQFPNAESTSAIRNALESMKYEAIQRAGQYSGTHRN